MQHLVLSRPLVFLDLETTGINPTTDRIVEMSLIKVHPIGLRETMTCRVNPGIPIPPESSRVHGITDADVAGAPTFAHIAPDVLAFIGDADVAGFNIQRFDLPMLLRELTQAGLRLDMTGRAVVDAQIIYHRRVPRDLSAAYRLYCGKDLNDPHTAQADVEACVEILDAQLAAYPDLPRTPQELSDLFNPRDPNAIDPGRKFIWKDGEAVFNIGKYRDRPLREIAAEDPEYLRWILGSDFDQTVKDILQEALEGRFPARGDRVSLPPAAERVCQALVSLGITAQIQEFPQGTRTAQEAARAIGTTLGQIVKSLVFVADGRPLLVLASGRNRVDSGKLARAAGATRVERADAELVRATTGYAIGGVPPVGHATPLETFIDEDLLKYDIVYAAAGTPTAIFPIAPADLVRVTSGRMADLAQPQ